MANGIADEEDLSEGCSECPPIRDDTLFQYLTLLLKASFCWEAALVFERSFVLCSFPAWSFWSSVSLGYHINLIVLILITTCALPNL